MDLELDPSVTARRNEIVADRRALHRIPEEGNEERKTSAYIRRVLEGLRPDSIESLTGTGIKAVFRGTQSRAVALRADMDGLKIAEETGCEFSSEHEGYMHACGHDGHCAMTLGAARIIAAARAENAPMPTVTLLFQPAEESVGGAARMIAQGALRGPDASEIYGLHLMPQVPVGSIAINEGPMMASTCEMDIVLEGKSAHGAMPHQGIDCVAAACHLYALLQTLTTRQINPQHPALITVGRLTAGTRRNIIAPLARLEGIVRSLSPDADECLHKAIRAAMAAVDAAFGTRSRIEEVSRFPVVNNNAELARKAIALLGGEALSAVPLMTAEDFSYYQLEIPGVFAFLGCGDETHNTPLHSSEFQFNETALLYGVEFYRRILFNAA